MTPAIVVPVAASNATARRVAVSGAALFVATVLLVASMLIVTIAAWHSTVIVSTSVQAAVDLPLDQWLLMHQAAAASGCGLDWTILAGIGKVESDFGRNRAMFEPHDGGIVGIVQMKPGNWAIFGPPDGNPFASKDAYLAAARYLCAHGAAQNIRAALFAYNHADWYVAEVLHWAAIYGAANPAIGIAGGPAGSRDSAASSTGSSALGAEIVSVAGSWKHVPYVWGGSTRGGVDCSGLVKVVFAQFGVKLPHNAQLQYNAVPHVTTAELEPGDLVFFAQTYPSTREWITHVGIYIGDGLMLNAPTTGDVVRAMPVFTGFWGAHYAGAGRVPVPRRSADCSTCA
jgi:cell wall-associated NlpC family hydrolase